jgi:hypothetical protein
MEQATATANMTGKPLIESDRVEGTNVYDRKKTTPPPRPAHSEL